MKPSRGPLGKDELIRRLGLRRRASVVADCEAKIAALEHKVGGTRCARAGRKRHACASWATPRSRSAPPSRHEVTRCSPCCMPALFGMPNIEKDNDGGRFLFDRRRDNAKRMPRAMRLWLMKWPRRRSSWVTRQWPSPASSSWMPSMRVTPAGGSGLHRLPRRGRRTPWGS
jgi:hypothetical protein